MRAELAAELMAKNIVGVFPNDHACETFCVRIGDDLHLVSGRFLSIDYTWPLGGARHGSALAAERLALVGGEDRVTLLEPDGSSRWSFEHAAWAYYERGATWFDRDGRPFALVKADGSDTSAVVRLDPTTGAVLAEVPIGAAPNGVVPIHHPDGWVGLSVYEGQDAARAWWVRVDDDADEPAVIAPEWDHVHLYDVAGDGEHVLTGPHDRSSGLELRSFPSLEVVRVLPEPEGVRWDGAVLAGEHVVARTTGSGTYAIAPDGTAERLDGDDYWIFPAGDSFLAAHPHGLQRFTLAP